MNHPSFEEDVPVEMHQDHSSLRLERERQRWPWEQGTVTQLARKLQGHTHRALLEVLSGETGAQLKCK